MSHVPSMRGAASGRPRCSKHGTKMERVKEGWVCRTCFNAFLHERASNIELPAGVEPEDRFALIFPNRRARRG